MCLQLSTLHWAPSYRKPSDTLRRLSLQTWPWKLLWIQHNVSIDNLVQEKFVEVLKDYWMLHLRCGHAVASSCQEPTSAPLPKVAVPSQIARTVHHRDFQSQALYWLLQLPKKHDQSTHYKNRWNQSNWLYVTYLILNQVLVLHGLNLFNIIDANRYFCRPARIFFCMGQHLQGFYILYHNITKGLMTRNSLFWI